MELKDNNIEAIKIALSALNNAKEQIINAEEMLNTLYNNIENHNDSNNINNIVIKIKNNMIKHIKIFDKDLFYIQRWGPMYIDIQKVMNNNTSKLLSIHFKWIQSCINQSEHKTGFLNVFKNMGMTGKDLIIALIDLKKYQTAIRVYNIIKQHHQH